MDKIAVLIPCYNEAKTIAKVVNDFKVAIPDATIYVYDNNSTDNTAKVAANTGKAIVRHCYQQGKGNVIRKMFREIDAIAYIIVDGDDTYPADNAKEMTTLIIEKGVDMVVGDRLSSTYFEENKRPFHNFGNAFVRLSINKLFKTNIKDIMTGYRAFSYEFVKTFPVLSKGFEIETEMTIHAADKNMHVENVIINYRDRPEGSVSKLNTCTDGLKVILTILRLFRTYKPLRYFEILSLVSFLLGSIYIAPVFSEYFNTGLVTKMPTLVVCCFAYLTSLIALFVGLLLETQTWKNRQDFEMQLIETNRYKRYLSCLDETQEN